MRRATLPMRAHVCLMMFPVGSTKCCWRTLRHMGTVNTIHHTAVMINDSLHANDAPTPKESPNMINTMASTSGMVLPPI